MCYHDCRILLHHTACPVFFPHHPRSVRSGQCQWSCFEEIASKTLGALAADGGCARLSVELDLLEGEETPRVTVRGAQPLADIAATAALQLTCRVDMPTATEEMARLPVKRDDARGRGIVPAIDPLTDDEIRIELARGFALGPAPVSRPHQRPRVP